MKKFNSFVNYLLVVLLFMTGRIKLDIPVHCPRNKIDGEWVFRINK